MRIKNLSFITPRLESEKIILEKEYSKFYTLPDNSSLSIASNCGLKENQEDSLAVTENNGYILLLVSDGMGGLQNGEIASYITAKTIKNWLERENLETLQKLDSEKLNQKLNEILMLLINTIPINSGATLNMSIIGPEITLIANIGDSRTYTIKDNKMTLRTEDDSLAFKIFNPTEKNQRDRLRYYRKNNILTNSISKKIKPTIKITIVKNEDYDIICHITDGISDILTEDKIKLCCRHQNAAISLVNEAVSSNLEYTPTITSDFVEYIFPKDNATAIVYKTLKRTNKRLF